jgi:ribosomal-protein-alanine N-acetyltransferase
MSRVAGLWQRVSSATGSSSESRAGRVLRDGDAGVPNARVHIREPRHDDEREFVTLMHESRAFHRQWATAPTDSARFAAYLEDSRRLDFEAFLVCRSADDQIIGFFNISQITRGSLQSAYLGYAAAERYAGQGYMREAIQLVLREAFVELRLHRLEANIQPGNQASLALAKGAGFKREGFSPRYLKISGRWRDHERWALLADDWRNQVQPS